MTEKNRDAETGCIVFLLFATLIIIGVVASVTKAELRKVRSENNDLKKKVSELELLTTEYKWQLEQVPYIIERACKGEE